MKSKSSIITTIIPALGIVILILDSKTAFAGATEGLKLCCETVIPCLLPFFFLSTLLIASLSGRSIKFMYPLNRLCGFPKGTEVLLLIGFLGGYPVGAQSIAQAYRNGYLSQKDAHRLLGFCSNAGPSFIFGILGGLFPERSSVWLLWGIHIVSALCVGMLLPHRNLGTNGITNQVQQRIDLPTAVAQALRVMAGVCGWIILMRVAVAFMDRWFLWLLPDSLRILVIGLLELTNGCHMLFEIDSEPLRFIVSAVLLGFGGICVSMQTVSVTQGLGTGMYFPGKLAQGFLSLLLAASLCPLAFPQKSTLSPYIALFPLLFLATTVIISAVKRRNNSSNFGKACV